MPHTWISKNGAHYKKNSEGKQNKNWVSSSSILWGLPLRCSLWPSPYKVLHPRITCFSSCLGPFIPSIDASLRGLLMMDNVHSQLQMSVLSHFLGLRSTTSSPGSGWWEAYLVLDPRPAKTAFLALGHCWHHHSHSSQPWLQKKSHKELFLKTSTRTSVQEIPNWSAWSRVQTSVSFKSSLGDFSFSQSENLSQVLKPRDSTMKSGTQEGGEAGALGKVPPTDFLGYTWGTSPKIHVYVLLPSRGGPARPDIYSGVLFISTSFLLLFLPHVAVSMVIS